MVRSLLDDFPDEQGYEVNAEYEEEDGGDSQYSMNIPVEQLGKGYFDQNIGKLKDGVDLARKRFYQSVPRPDDSSPLTVPPDHPLRAIARVLEDAPLDSVIRVMASVLTDKYAIDLLLRFCLQHDLRVILNYEDPQHVVDAANVIAQGGHARTFSINRIAAFLSATEIAMSHAVFTLAQFRVVDNSARTWWRGGSCMHENAVITEIHTVTGSYNLSNFARCRNYNSVQVVDTDQERIDSFDRLWASLEGRDIVKMYPCSFPESIRILRKRKFQGQQERK